MVAFTNGYTKFGALGDVWNIIRDRKTSLETEKQQKTSKSRKHGKPSKKDQVWKLAVGRHRQRNGAKYEHGSDGKGCLELAASQWGERNAYYVGESTESALSSCSPSSWSNSSATRSLFLNSPAFPRCSGLWTVSSQDLRQTQTSQWWTLICPKHW